MLLPSKNCAVQPNPLNVGDYGQTQAKELEEQQEEEGEHDGTCLLRSPTAGNIAGGREQNICHLSSIWTYMLESTAQRGNRSAAVSQEGRLDLATSLWTHLG